jgi:hypothetical protein
MEYSVTTDACPGAPKLRVTAETPVTEARL